MRILIRNKDFVNNFIKPILDIDPIGKTSILIENDELYTIIKPSDLVVLYTKFTSELITDSNERFNINLNQLNKGLSCLHDELVDLNIEHNNLQAKNDNIMFSIVLLNNSVVASPPIQYKQLDEQTPIGEFIITRSVISDISKAYVFNKAAKKIYIEKLS